MSVTRPEEMNGAFAEAVNSGDLERVLALYEPEAVLAPRPGERAHGLAEIRAALHELLSLGGEIESRNVWCIQVGELALLRGEWRLRGTAPDGSPLELASPTAEVVRRQPDGSWLYVIDHAFEAD
jgi:ketosteroid isomerase-like protein